MVKDNDILFDKEDAEEENFDISDVVKGVSMNTHHIFLWNRHSLWKFRIHAIEGENDTFGRQIRKMDLYVDKLEQ